MATRSFFEEATHRRGLGDGLGASIRATDYPRKRILQQAAAIRLPRHDGALLGRATDHRSAKSLQQVAGDAHSGEKSSKSPEAVGVVTGIQGKRTFRVTVTGEAAHAGTARHQDRKDALLAATAMIQALAKAMHDDADIVKFTVGRLEVRPNAPSVVAGEAVFSIDLRHPDEATLRALGDRVPGICVASAGPCKVEAEELVTAMPLQFPATMRSTITAAATRLGLRTMELPSAAGHDARYLHGICPSGMIFVPCKDGISHNEAESATPEDLYDGARVLADTLAELAG